MCALFDMFGPTFAEGWEIPVTVKVHGDQRVVYLDKPLLNRRYSMRAKNQMFFQTACSSVALQPSSRAHALVLKPLSQPKVGCGCPNEGPVEPIPAAALQDDNVVYNTWMLGEYRLLVRCRIHGYMQEPGNVKVRVTLRS
jgi:hypothetical protein